MRYKYLSIGWLIVCCTGCALLSNTQEVHITYSKHEDNDSAYGRVELFLEPNAHSTSYKEGKHYSTSHTYETDKEDLKQFAADIRALHQELGAKSVAMVGLRYKAYVYFMSNRRVQSCVARNVSLQSESTKKYVLHKTNDTFKIGKHNQDKGKYCYFYDKIYVDTVGEDLLFSVDFDVAFADGTVERIQRTVPMASQRALKKTTFLHVIGGL